MQSESKRKREEAFRIISGGEGPTRRSKSRRREEGEELRSPVKSATITTMSPLSPGQEETFTRRPMVRSSQACTHRCCWYIFSCYRVLPSLLFQYRGFCSWYYCRWWRNYSNRNTYSFFRFYTVAAVADITAVDNVINSTDNIYSCFRFFMYTVAAVCSWYYCRW